VKRIFFIFFLLGLFSLGIFAQKGADASAAKTAPSNFKSDGCSMFPDGCYRECCVEHDKAYYAGGTSRERRAADKALFKCVAAKKGWWHRTFVAPVMWVGVRVGGVGFLPTPFRWGFGQKKEKNRAQPAAATPKSAESEKTKPEEASKKPGKF
jgi:hypothetical protein